MKKAALLALVVFVACGGDDDDAGSTQAGNPTAAKAPAKKPDDPNKPKLTPRLHVEDRVHRRADDMERCQYAPRLEHLA